MRQFLYLNTEPDLAKIRKETTRWKTNLKAQQASTDTVRLNFLERQKVKNSHQWFHSRQQLL